jgi:FixJ family two-component response regulator
VTAQEPRMPHTVLVVDDDDVQPRHARAASCTREGYERASTPAAGREALDRRCARTRVDRRAHRPQDARHVRHRPAAAARTLDPDVEVVVMTAYGTVETAVEAMKEGAYDFVSKPLKRIELVTSVCSKALEKRSLHPREPGVAAAQLGARRRVDDLIGGRSAPMRTCSTRSSRWRRPTPPCCSRASPGTGKTRLARFLHDRSSAPRGALRHGELRRAPRTLLESELFGHEAGAFTGAVARKEGRFAWPGRHAVPRRDHRDEPVRAGQAAARAPGRRVRARRRQPRRCGRRAHRRRHQPRPAGRGRRGPVPRGPVLPAQRHPPAPPPAARAARGRGAAHRPLPAKEYGVRDRSPQPHTVGRRPLDERSSRANIAGNVRELENADRAAGTPP